MNDAIALDAPPQVEHSGLEQAAALALFGMAGAVQFSIAAAQILLAVALICWIAQLVVRRERIEAPSFFWPLVAYGGATLVSAALSPDPRTSLIDCKQLVLFLLVPLVYRFVSGPRAHTLLTVVVTCAAVSAVFGIVQYGILHYDNLGQRPQGTLGHWMTYSGLLMIVIGVAIARVIFGKSDRTWAALVLPALGVAVALTFTRSAWVGGCAAVALLFSLKDFRLFALLPILAAIFIAIAPGQITKRYQSMFNMNDPTVRDRMTMTRIGGRMISAHPLTGVGPNMVQRLYVDYKGDDSLVGPDGVTHINPHLHNDFLQVAAERGLPALALWLWFVFALVRDLWKRFNAGQRELAATALATVIALLTAGLFEYNFGDSEILMLFLTVVSLPAAADRPAHVPFMTLPTIDAGRARDLVGRFAGLPVLVVGDVMLDRFIVGRVSRISPEAPVPIVRFESEHVRLGGAANVAHNIAALGGRASLVGIVGADAAAAQLRAQLAAAGVAADGLVEDAARPTTEKVRVVTERNQQVARIDYERDADAAGDVERAIVAQVTRLAGQAKALLVSDYLKGAITRTLVEAMLRSASLSGERPPLIVDPKIPHLACYAGATLVTPNHHEAEIATHLRVRSDDEARQAARDFRTRAQCDAVLITRGEQGMWLSEKSVEGSIPAVAREVSDVTGAGDTVVATLALALAAGATMAEAAALANQAAGIVVGKFGPATLTASELASSF